MELIMIVKFVISITFICSFEGFSLIGDIHMIKHALPELNFSLKQMGCLDLCSIWKHLDKFPKFKFPYEGKKRAIFLV